MTKNRMTDAARAAQKDYGKNAQYSEVILIDIEKAKNRYVTDVITKMEK